MADETATNKAFTFSDLIGMLAIAGFLGFVYAQFFGNPLAFLAGDNLLEKATQVGKSDKAQMDAFTNAGGLDVESTWKGFRVTGLRVVYEDSGKLGLVVLSMYKSFPGKKLASIDNLQSAMAGECGGNWTKSMKFGSAVLEGQHTSSGVRCTALDPGGLTVEVTLTKTADSKQSAPSPAAISPPPQMQAQAQAQAPSPARNFEQEALSDIAFVNPKEAMTDPSAVEAMREKYAFDVVAAPRMEQVFRSLLGKDYSTLVDFIGVAGPVEADPVTGELFGDGMVAHTGGEQGGAFTLGKNGKVVAVLVDKSKPQRISIYGAASLQQLSPALATFVSNARD